MVRKQETEQSFSPRGLVLNKKQVAQEKRLYRWLKRVFDIVLSFVVLVVLFVPMLILAVIICMDSPGASPIFCQKRVGMNGKEFIMIKFRTMIPNASEMKKDLLELNEMTGPVFKIKNDPRITRVGHVIRKVSVDELPQLVNVLLGDMTIVGPRPPLPEEVAQYNAYEMQRLYVQTGLTCYWQIQPHRNDLTFDEWVDLDIKYIKERSIATDSKIIVQTVGAIFKGEGE